VTTHGTRSTGPVPLGRGGTEPTRVLLVPDGALPSATTLVPAVIASAAAAGAVTVSVPVLSTRAKNAGRLPTRTETTDRPRKPTPPTRRPAPFCVTTAAGAPAAEPRPTTTSRAGRMGLSVADGPGVVDAVLAPGVPEAVSAGVLTGAGVTGELDPVPAPDVVGGMLVESLGLDVDAPGEEVVGDDVAGTVLLAVGAEVSLPDGVGVVGVVTGVEVQLTDSLSALPP